MKKVIIILIIVLIVILLIAVAIYTNALSNTPSYQIKRLEKEYRITLPKDIKVLYFTTWVGDYPIAKLQISDDDVNSMRDMVSNSYHEDTNTIIPLPGNTIIPLPENAFPEEWGWLDDMKHVVYRYQKGFDPHRGRNVGTCWIYFIKAPSGENYLYLWKG